MTIGIIGFGRFGVLAASILKKHGRVYVYDAKKLTARARRIGVEFTDLKTAAGCDIVILSVPISRTENMIKKISRLVNPGALIMDTCSVKVYPCQWLKRYLPKTVDILGTHPMFGPITAEFNETKRTWKLKDRTIVLCPLRLKNSRLAAVKKFLRQLGLNIIIASPDEHDRQTAASLGFMHYLGRALWEAGFRKQKIYPLGYLDLLRVYRTTTGDSWELMYDMNTHNPYAKEVRKRFLKMCGVIEGKIRRRGNIVKKHYK